MTSELLHVNSVSRSFGDLRAVHNLTMQVRGGEIFGLMGPDGAGKTTLLNIVAGFLAPTEGQIVMNGHTVTGPNAERGMVFQQGALFEWMSVRENVSFGPRTTDGKRAWDTFATLLATTKKLGVSFYRYVYDRVSAAHEIPDLADLIAQRAQQLDLDASWEPA